MTRHDNRILWILILGVMVLGVGTARALPQQGRPEAVSPGGGAPLARIGAACPTFSWTAAPGAERYELVVYAVGEGGAESMEVLRRGLPGGATSWTPSLDSCLARGGRYAWAVRAEGNKESSDWSAPSLFEVASGPSEEEFEEAVAVVRQYLGAAGTTVTQGAAGTTVVQGAAAVTRDPPAQEGSSAPGGAQVDSRLATPSITSLVTEGAIGVGTDTPQADLHVVGSPSLGSLLVAPNAIPHGGTSELFLAEDDDGEFGFSLRYDGGANALKIYGFATGADPGPLLGPWLTIDRHGEEVSFGAPLTGDAFQASVAGALCEAIDYRFVDRGDGTVLDCNTGKMWLKDASCLGTGTWDDTGTSVFDLVADLNDTGMGSDFGCEDYIDGTYTDWQVPEMEDLCGLWNGSCTGTACCTASAGIVDTSVGPNPSVGNAEGDGKWSEGDAFVGVQSNHYWSATEADTNNAWNVNLDLGYVNNDPKGSIAYVWPVRGGQ